ncbi:MAG TPA: CDP-glucose 4,6-dehydratase, partial [Chryseosolibacter sp.]
MPLVPFNGAYRNKKVLITGNTGFKGSWLSLWLSLLQAKVYGYSLQPPTHPSLFEDLHLDRVVELEQADVLDFGKLKNAIRRIQPDIIFHLAAQSLVRESYARPMETIQVNTMGSLHVMEAVRQLGMPMAIVMVTSDKCYENKEWVYGYRESDAPGGYDPYSSSKGAAEVLISSWRNSFFNKDRISGHGVRLASVRAGNVIGGGDWAADRIVPDCIRDLNEG